MFVRTENSEPILDRLQERFGSLSGFRALLIQVEATLPPIAPAEPARDIDTKSAKPEIPVLPGRLSREELLNDLQDGMQLSVVYLVMAGLSAIVAAIGLMRNNVAILIGAMVMAPLLTPNVALALATTLGDLELARRALKTNIVGTAVVFALAVVIGALMAVDPNGPELLSRTRLGIGDIVLALAAGIAGTLSYTTGVASGLIGVMVAVALVPPIVAVGLLVGAGQFALAFGAFLLLATNIICVNLAAVVTFLLRGIRPRTWWEADRAKRSSLIAATMWSLILAALVGIVLFARAAR